MFVVYFPSNILSVCPMVPLSWKQNTLKVHIFAISAVTHLTLLSFIHFYMNLSNIKQHQNTIVIHYFSYDFRMWVSSTKQNNDE